MGFHKIRTNNVTFKRPIKQRIMDLIKNIYSLLIAMLVSVSAFSQEKPCSDYFKTNGLKHFKVSEYHRALYNFRAMETCKTFSKEDRDTLMEKTRSCIKLKNRADKLFKKENYTRAKKSYNKILAINPADAYVKDQIKNCKIFSEPVPEGMVLVKSGSMSLGGESFGSERPPHPVKLNSFYLSKTEVTNAQYAEFLNAYQSDTVKTGRHAGKILILEDSTGVVKNDGKWTPAKGYANHPVIYVSWYGAREFCKWKDARLPTEAEWEFAARGGVKSKNYLYAGSDEPKEVAWFYPNADKKPHEVAQKAPNEIGIYDMSGNVYEWVYDWFAKYSSTKEDNPTGPKTGNYKVIRGGSWYDYPSHLRVSNRNNYSPDYKSDLIGFRYAKTPEK